MEFAHKNLSRAIIGAGMEVHRLLGRGYLEKVYQHALEHELHLRSLPFEAQIPVVVNYKDVSVGDFRLDFVVSKLVVVEIKAISGLTPADTAQLLNYVKCMGLSVGLLLNFGAGSLEFKRVVC
jgi:GxxExxY protein